MKIKIKHNNRGFLIGEFKDLYGLKCSIQESSLATDNAIWLGSNTGLHHHGECLARMHLNQNQVKSLLPLLEYFAQTGRLPKGKK